MSKLQLFKDFVTDRLAAAALEILGEYEKTLSECQEEICRSKEKSTQRQSILNIQPETKLHRTDLPPSHLRALVSRCTPETPLLAQPSSAGAVPPPLQRPPVPQEAPQTLSPSRSREPSPAREQQEETPGAEPHPGGAEPEREEQPLVAQQPQPSEVTEQPLVAQQPQAPEVTEQQQLTEEPDDDGEYTPDSTLEVGPLTPTCRSDISEIPDPDLIQVEEEVVEVVIGEVIVIEEEVAEEIVEVVVEEEVTEEVVMEEVESAGLRVEEEEPEMELDQAPPTVPIPAPEESPPRTAPAPAPEEPPVKRGRGRPRKNAPKPASPPNPADRAKSGRASSRATGTLPPSRRRARGSRRTPETPLLAQPSSVGAVPPPLQRPPVPQEAPQTPSPSRSREPSPAREQQEETPGAERLHDSILEEGPPTPIEGPPTSIEGPPTPIEGPATPIRRPDLSEIPAADIQGEEVVEVVVEEEVAAGLRVEEEEPVMELDQAPHTVPAPAPEEPPPPTVPAPAPEEPPVKRRRGRPPKKAPPPKPAGVVPPLQRPPVSQEAPQTPIPSRSREPSPGREQQEEAPGAEPHPGMAEPEREEQQPQPSEVTEQPLVEQQPQPSEVTGQQRLTEVARPPSEAAQQTPPRLTRAQSTAATEKIAVVALLRLSTRGPTETAPDRESTRVPTETAPDRESTRVPTETALDRESTRVPTETAPDRVATRGPTETAPDQVSTRVPIETVPDRVSTQGPTETTPDRESTRGPTETAPDRVSTGEPTETAPDRTSPLSQSQFLTQLGLSASAADSDPPQVESDDLNEPSPLPSTSTDAAETRTVSTETSPGDTKEGVRRSIGDTRELLFSHLRARLRPRLQSSATETDPSQSPTSPKKPRMSKAADADQPKATKSNQMANTQASDDQSGTSTVAVTPPRQAQTPTVTKRRRSTARLQPPTCTRHKPLKSSPCSATTRTQEPSTPPTVNTPRSSLKPSPVSPRRLPSTTTPRSATAVKTTPRQNNTPTRRKRQKKVNLGSPHQPLQRIGDRLLKNQCGACGLILDSTAELESHVSSLHMGEQPFACTLCGKSFPDDITLNRHARVHSGESHACPQCGKAFAYRFGLTQHLQTVHGHRRPFVCQVCEKSFYTRRDVEAHIMIHTGEKPFPCTLCDKSFKRRVELNVHMRWHSGEKRHWCPTCGKGFLDSNNLKRHKMIHTGEKPHHCPKCKKSFTQSGHLKKHLKNVHKADSEDSS